MWSVFRSSGCVLSKILQVILSQTAPFSPLNNVLIIFQKAGALKVQANAAREAKGCSQDKVQHSTGWQIYRETAVLLWSRRRVFGVLFLTTLSIIWVLPWIILNPTPSGSILNLFHLGATIFCHHTYSFWVRQFFANIRFILYFLILPLHVLAIFCRTQKE